MGKKQKLLDRLYSKPKDFKWGEVTTLLTGLGYKKIEGKGSRVKFFRKFSRNLIIMHKPHPGDILKEYQVKNLISHIKSDE